MKQKLCFLKQKYCFLRKKFCFNFLLCKENLCFQNQPFVLQNENFVLQSENFTLRNENFVLKFCFAKRKFCFKKQNLFSAILMSCSAQYVFGGLKYVKFCSLSPKADKTLKAIFFAKQNFAPKTIFSYFKVTKSSIK